MTDAAARSFEARVVSEYVGPAQVRSMELRVVSPLVGPANLRSMELRVVSFARTLLQPGQYVKADDGEWYPMVQFPWTT